MCIFAFSAINGRVFSVCLFVFCHGSLANFSHKFPPAWIVLLSLFPLCGSLSTPEKPHQAPLSLTTELSQSLRTVLSSLPHLCTSRQGSRQRGYSTEPPHSSAVLLPLAVISLSHWSMIHVCEGLGLLARCTAARCRHCAAHRRCLSRYNDWTHSECLTCDGYVSSCRSARERERWTLRERWIDRQEKKGVRVKDHAEHMLLT